MTIMVRGMTKPNNMSSLTSFYEGNTRSYFMELDLSFRITTYLYSKPSQQVTVDCAEVSEDSCEERSALKVGYMEMLE